MNYICSSLAHNYLRISQFNSYELWKKTRGTTDTMQFLYAKHQANGQITFCPKTKLYECKRVQNKYILSEIDQR